VEELRRPKLQGDLAGRAGCGAPGRVLRAGLLEPGQDHPKGAEDALRLIRQFRERGVTLVSVQEPWLNSSPEITDVLVGFAGWMGQQESARCSERIKAGIARRAAEGGHTGRKPGKNKPKLTARARLRPDIDDREAPLVRTHYYPDKICPGCGHPGCPVTANFPFCY
jgi:hypothetical protein